ncbi:MAG: ATP-binding protein [Eubacteriaceae bacterium]|jgi:signal transduction histidine kinase/PAS domain-containing protein|nr:ATP-binding protein [Eubacteriaceae bacterium]
MSSAINDARAGCHDMRLQEINDETLKYLIDFTPGKKAFYLIEGEHAKALYLSPKLYEFIGLDKNESSRMKEVDSLDFVVPEDRAGLTDVMHSCIATGEPFEYYWRIKRIGADHVWVHAEGCICGTRSGRPVIMVVYNSLSADNDIYQTVIDGTQSMVYVCDRNTYDILYANRAAKGNREVRDGDPLERKCYRYIQGNDKPCKDCILKYDDGNGQFDRIRYNDFHKKWEHQTGKNINWCGHEAIVQYISDITELKNLQELYENEQKRYSTAVSGANLSVWEYRVKEHRIISGQKSLDKYDLSDVIEDVPNSILNLIMEEDRNSFLDMFRKIEAGDEHVSGDFWMEPIPSRNKPPVCEHVVYTVKKDENGEPDIAYGVSIDVTSQERERMHFKESMQELLTANHESLCHFTVNLTQDICHEGQGKSPDVVKAISSDTFDGLIANIAALIPSREQKTTFKNIFCRGKLIEEFESGRDNISLDYERMNTKGKVISVITSLKLIKNPQTGDITGAMYSVNITHQKRLERILKIITSQEHQMVSLLDMETRKIEAVYLGDDMPAVYREFFKASGDICDAETLKKRSLETWLLAEDAEIYNDATNVDTLPAKLNDEGHLEFTVRTNPDGGSGKIKFRKFQHYWLDNEHRQIIIITSDVTQSVIKQQEELEKERELREQALAANVAKTDFLSRMSHDIRTPINGIMGMVYIAESQENPEKTEECLRKINTSSKFLLGLVNEVLDMSKAESGQLEFYMEPYRPEALKEYLYAVIKPLCDDKDINFIFREDQAEGVVPVTDILRINQIYFNLLSNAVKYTPEGGTVTCIVRTRILSTGRLAGEFEVKDTGIGISKEFQKRLFDPFAQENRSDTALNRGTGLGLSIVKKIVDMMDGTITVESAINAGTSFKVNLEFDCISADTADAISREETFPDDRDLSGMHVLLCEDHPLNQEIARAMLESSHAFVSIAENGQKGLETFIQSGVGYYDVILMDLRMPVLDGYGATKAIRSLERTDAQTVPIIAMTADAFLDDVKKCLDAGMNGHIAKPVDPVKLQHTILEMTAQNRR